MSVHMGQRMARIMAGNTAANPLKLFPWGPIPGHVGPPSFMPFVGAYYGRTASPNRVVSLTP